MRFVQFTDEAPDPPMGMRAAEVAANRVTDKASLMDALAEAFGFPEWFGRNWDALRDALADSDLNNGVAYLVIRGATELWREHPRLAGTLVEVWLDAASERRRLQLVFEW